MRIDMPGCPVSDLVYWVDGDNVNFFADEPDMTEYDHPGRKYGGKMVFNGEVYRVKDTKVKLINGVLWMDVPKIPGKTVKKINVIETVFIEIKILENDNLYVRVDLPGVPDNAVRHRVDAVRQKIVFFSGESFNDCYEKQGVREYSGSAGLSCDMLRDNKRRRQAERRSL
ncbi:unnamed protein product [Cochlearia groenlandica]